MTTTAADPILGPVMSAVRKPTQFPTLVDSLDTTIRELDVLHEKALVDTDVRTKLIALVEKVLPLLLSRAAA